MVTFTNQQVHLQKPISHEKDNHFCVSLTMRHFIIATATVSSFVLSCEDYLFLFFSCLPPFPSRVILNAEYILPFCPRAFLRSLHPLGSGTALLQAGGHNWSLSNAQEQAAGSTHFDPRGRTGEERRGEAVWLLVGCWETIKKERQGEKSNGKKDVCHI